jgi:Tfp pilus assembly protein PilO
VNRRNLLIGVAAGLAVLVLWYLLLWSPRSKAIDKAKSRQTTASDALQELRAERNRLADLRSNEAATRARIEQLRQAIPDSPNLAQFILDANDAANQSGIDFLSISPTPPASADTPAGAEGPPPAQISLGITVTGGYFQVLDFVNRLNRLTRIVVIDTLSLSGGATSGLSVQLGGRMFVSAAPAGASAPAAVSTTTTTPGATTTTAPGATTTVAPAGTPTTVAG